MNPLDTLFNEKLPWQRHVAAEAAALLATWRRLETSHLPISFGCACGTVGHIRAQDFEQDVLGYLADKYAQAPAESAFLRRYGGRENNCSGGITAMLQDIADDPRAAEPMIHLLSDLKRSISSWSNAGLASARID